MPKAPDKTKVQHVFILDQSGSMGAIKRALVTGFNEQVQNIKQAVNQFEDQEQRVTFVVFDGIVDIKYLDRAALNLEELTEDTYKTCGTTALYDAIVTTIKQVRETGSKRVILNILTDGDDTGSQTYTAIDAKEHIEQAKKDGWVVTLVGAKIDVEAMIAQLGIPRGNAINFDFDPRSVANVSRSMNNSRTGYLRSMSAGVADNVTYYNANDSITNV